MKRKEFYFLFVRYFALIVLGFFNLGIIYFVFTPLTIYPVYWIAYLADDSIVLDGSLLLYKGIYAAIIPACVAGAAYYALLILNLSTPMNYKLRIKSLLFILTSFLLLNIIRIVIFLNLGVNGYKYFNIAHLATWYAGSTLLVVLIWFWNVRLLKIKSIPVYSDFKRVRNTKKEK